MNSVPHDLVELHSCVKPCKTQCFVFTDVDLPSEINFLEEKMSMNEKMNNGSTILAYKKENLSTTSSTASLENRKKSRRMMAIVSVFVGLVLLAAGIPLGLQLRSSSLLEARLSFIKRLLLEAPLIEGIWSLPAKNFSQSYTDIRDSSIGALLYPIHVPCGSQYLDAVQLALEGIDEAKRVTDKTSGIRIVEDADEMEQAYMDGEMAVLLGLEGGHALGSSLAVVRMIHALGARFVSLAGPVCTTPWAASASITKDLIFDNNKPDTLTPFGQIMLKEINRLGILAEISHLNEPGMMMVLNAATAPVLISNALPAAMCNSNSSIPDHVLSALSQNGGIITIGNKCDDKMLTTKETIAAINYARSLTGLDHVALGGSAKNLLLLAELARDRLWSNAALKKLVGVNILRVLREVEGNKNRIPLSEDWIPTEEIEENAYCRYPET